MKKLILTLALAVAAIAVQAEDKACPKSKAACTDKNKAACCQKTKAAGGMCSSISKQSLMSPKAADAKR